MKYLKEIELQALSDKELDYYASIMMTEQLAILDLIDQWTAYYDLIAAEYQARKNKRSITIENESGTIH